MAESILIPSESPITKIAGYATLQPGQQMRVSRIDLFIKGSDIPIRHMGQVNAGSRAIPFSFDSEPGEVIQAFFRSCYASSDPVPGEEGAEFLGSIGVWVQKTWIP